MIKKVLYFHHASIFDGSSLSLVKIIRRLDKNKYNPLIVLREDGPLVEHLEAAGATIYFDRHQYPFGYCSGFHPEWWELGLYRSILRFPLSVWTGFRWVKRIQPDIVHINSMVFIACGIGAKLSGFKTVLHIREEALRGWLGFRRKIVSFLINYFFDRMIAICKANRTASGVDPEHCAIVYNWVAWDKNVTFDSSVLRKKLDISESTRVILFLGGEVKIKGVEILYEALAQLKNADDVVVVCAGRKLNSTKKKVREYKAQLECLEKSIKVPLLKVGIVENVEAYLALSDFLVVPSVVPHFSNPLIEAAWLGRPTIMSNDRIGQEMIKDGEDGLLFDPQCPAALAERIERLLNDSVLCRLMGGQAKKRAHATCSSANIQKIESIYEEIIN